MAELPVMTVDFETRSFKNVTDVGAWRYAEDPTTEILCLSYKLGGGRSNLWVPGFPFPQVILDHVEAGGIFEAHNVQFERAVWYHLLYKAQGIPMPKRWRDTMAACAYRGLPLSLDKAGNALCLPVQKNKRGKYLLGVLSTPKGPTKAEPNRIYREDLDLMEELYSYCQDDADSEYCLSEALGPLPQPEQRIWVLDQIINQRGVYLDLPAVKGALAVAERVIEDANKELSQLTAGEVETGTSVAALTNWIRKRGVRIDNLQKDTVDSFIKTCEDPDVVRALQIRKIVGKTSTSKLYSMLDTVCEDLRIRGLLQYHGASTGRWSGRLVQPQNFPRGNLNLLKILSQEEIIEILKKPAEDAHIEMSLIFGEDVIDAISTVLRGMFIASPGKVFMVSDFAAIEARVVMWMAGCKSALEAFFAYDRGEGPDIYCVMAEKLYGRPINKKDDPDERQLGKVTILGCGYGMGVDKFIMQAEKDYGLTLTVEMAERAVYGYRETYSEVKSLWYALQDAAVNAVETGRPTRASCVVYRLERDAAGTWLSCQLPNGRKLWYLDPVVETRMVVKPWDKETGKKTAQKELSYMGRDNKRGGMWGRIRTYGGMLTENCVQAIARDLMVEGMIRVERSNYPVVLTVHDEIVSEVDEDFGSIKEFESLMAGPVPDWAKGCPVAVEGWTGTRYRK